MSIQKLKDKYHPNILDFEYCTGYIKQATRYNLTSLTSEDSLIFAGTKNENLDSSPVIVVAIGKDRAEQIIKYAKHLAESHQQDVIIKNVGLGLEEKLKEVGFEDYSFDEAWLDESKYDDNTFPQQVVNVQDCLSLQGSKYRRLRSELRRFDKRYGLDVRKSTGNNFRRILNQWAEQMAERIEVNEDYYLDSNQMLDLELAYDIFDNKTNNLIGYLSFSEISEKCLGFNSLMNDYNYKNSYRRFMFEAVRIARDLGYPFLNLQGSEDYGQHKSKRVFQAEIEIPKKHLVYRFKP